MTCQEFVAFLMAYLDDELDGPVRVAFERHFQRDCPDCQVYLETYREAVRLSRVCQGGELPGDVPEHLLRAVLAARGPPHDEG
jgi:anti-sigma factor RsiW